MITNQLIDPKSIVVVGASDNLKKPGGATLKNLISSSFKGDLFVVNPHSESVQGIKSYKNIEDIPTVDCAILTIPARFCLSSVETLCEKKCCKAIIIISAGFHENSQEGLELEKKIVDVCNSTNTSLIGPNCIGMMNSNYAGVFTQPIPKLSSDGVILISGSGATCVFILELGMQLGVNFSQIYSVGNSAQIGVEDILSYIDKTYITGKSPKVIALYIESLNNPVKFAEHAQSLITKGAVITAVKAGSSSAGSRAASSHTGAMASPDAAVEALFKKVGIIRAYGRTELINITAVLSFPKPKGKRIGIITHAGGPAVMQTDIFSKNGFEIPHFYGQKADNLLKKLYPGSSVANPIDFLATGTAEQLGYCIDTFENDFNVDAITVIIGNPGLDTSFDIFKVVEEKIKKCTKPIYPVFTSVINNKNEIARFHRHGFISFSDEVLLASAIAKVMNSSPIPITKTHPPVDKKMIREVIKSNKNGYLPPDQVSILLDAAGINHIKEYIARTEEEAIKYAQEIGLPVVMKVVGPIHKSDVGGVTLNIDQVNFLSSEFHRMMKIEGTTGVLIQPMIEGKEIFIGAKKAKNFGHLIMCGLGGIYVEALKDITTSLTPVSEEDANSMINNLRSIRIIKGMRGQEGININLFNEMIRRVSALCGVANEICEMDINPLKGNEREIIAIDARIKINKTHNVIKNN